jgi:CoA:oxalate CoA-transferase
VTTPLDGVRVLDLTRVVSGPSCGRSLVELGADVIKLEPPEGDLTRKARPRVGGIPLYFSQLNAGKRCISVDLRTDEGRSLVLQIVERCDVLIENFRPGVTERLGLGYDDVHAINQGLVYCSITGYGQTGPRRNDRSYAPVVQAEVGHVDFVARQMGTSASQEAVSHADHAAGQQATIGILAALVARSVNGIGSHIDVSMAEAMWAINEWTAIEAAGGTKEVSVLGSHRAPIVTLADGTRAAVTGDPAGTFVLWARLMGRENLMEDPRFSSSTARNAHRHEMQTLIIQWAATVPDMKSLHAVLDGTGLVPGEIKTIAAAAAEPWAEHREAFMDVASGDETVRIPRSPIRMSGHRIGDRGASMWQGEANVDVLEELLGYDESTVAALLDQGVLHERRPS